MIEHIVVFKWKPEASSEDIEAAMEGLRGLRAQVPGIVALTCGKNFSERSQGFGTGLIVRFADRSALDGYVPHPAHQQVVETLIAPIRAEMVVVDYEVTE